MSSVEPPENGPYGREKRGRRGWGGEGWDLVPRVYREANECWRGWNWKSPWEDKARLPSGNISGKLFRTI